MPAQKIEVTLAPTNMFSVFRVSPPPSISATSNKLKCSRKTPADRTVPSHEARFVIRARPRDVTRFDCGVEEVASQTLSRVTDVM